MLKYFPETITAGISLKCEISVDEFPAPEWELHAILRGKSVIDLVAGISDETHVFEATAATTTDWDAGMYVVSIRAVSGGDVCELESGHTTIVADIAALGANHDPRGQAQRTLDAVEAVLEGRASKDQQSYTINGRTLVRTNIADLLELRRVYRAQVAADKAGGRGKKLLRRQIKTRFGT